MMESIYVVYDLSCKIYITSTNIRKARDSKIIINHSLHLLLVKSEGLPFPHLQACLSKWIALNMVNFVGITFVSIALEDIILQNIIPGKGSHWRLKYTISNHPPLPDVSQLIPHAIPSKYFLGLLN